MKTTAYCRVTAVQKSKSHSAAEKIKYIERTGRYKNKPGFVAGGRGNLPKGFTSHHQFWQLADQHERSNSVTAREFLIDLPDHLDMADALSLAKTYAKQITKCPDTERPLPYQWAVHADENGKSRHMHLVMSERVIDGIQRTPEQFFKRHDPKQPEKSGAPKLANNSSVLKRRTERVKRFIEKASNHFLKAAGLDMTVDFSRTVKEGKRPQIKLNAREWSMMKSGRYEPGTSKRIDEFLAIDEHNRLIDQLHEQQQILDGEIAIAEAEAQKQAQAPAAPATRKLTAMEKIAQASASANASFNTTNLQKPAPVVIPQEQEHEQEKNNDQQSGPGL